MCAASVWEGAVGLEGELAQLRQGNLDALGALVARYQNRLYRFLLRLAREPATAEDLFQQTWLRVAEKIRQYDARRNFDAWLFTLARNLAIDHQRRFVPESLDEPADEARGGSRAEQLPSSQPSALHRAMEQERSQRLARAMAELPVMYREVLTLRFEEEMKLEEIAEVSGAPLSTVKTRLRRALESMRQNLEARYRQADWQ